MFCSNAAPAGALQQSIFFQKSCFLIIQLANSHQNTPIGVALTAFTKATYDSCKESIQSMIIYICKKKRLVCNKMLTYMLVKTLNFDCLSSVRAHTS
ncbi:hypothetical protein QL285_091295 [Trifolium repens]|nr:hypothetical protein QL285_091295 [Trifolium repens]